MEKVNAPSSGEIQLAADFYGTANTYDIEYLVVAGGGATGQTPNGMKTMKVLAGGAGGYRTLTATLTPGNNMTVTGGGGGGNGGYGNGTSDGLVHVYIWR